MKAEQKPNAGIIPVWVNALSRAFTQIIPGIAVVSVFAGERTLTSLTPIILKQMACHFIKQLIIMLIFKSVLK
ncbi:MAG: hypothetical protein PHW13_02555 [Methylococcales bacterium]|nr:hypothetical protein [Methylococcales bacterium]